MTPQALPNYPLKLEPIYKEKVWGGRTLETLGRKLPGGPQTRIGESWELADLGQTSVSGGGGGAERSRIANGPLAGQTLHDVMHRHRRELMGDLAPNERGEFPLLLKFLDAQENLSVQVHPSPAYAATHPDAFLKSEAWYIVQARPGAVIYKGVREGVTPERFRQAIEQNDLEPLLIKVEVKPGQCHYLPSGTCHALGGGVLVAEVQTPSDTTFRVYDWGRQGRELHIEQAMQSIHFGPPDVRSNERPAIISNNGLTFTRLVVCEHFHVDRLEASAGYTQELTADEPVIWMTLSGRATIHCQAMDATVLGPGETVYLPPAMRQGRLSVQEDFTCLEITFPQAQPLRIA